MDKGLDTLKTRQTETAVKIKDGDSCAYYTSCDSRERLTRFFNALRQAEDASERARLVESMGFERRRSRHAKEMWSYEVGSGSVSVMRNNCNPTTGNFAHGKRLSVIELAVPT